MFAQLPSLKALRAFESAARHNSFSKAAEELALTQGAISYQIKQLEQGLGTLMFQRKTRQIVLTEAGQQLYQSVHRLFVELQSDLNQIVPKASTDRLTIGVSTYFVTRWLSPKLGGFINKYPNVKVLLQHTVNNPDFDIDDVDVAIHWGDDNCVGCQAELLLDLPMIAVCAPTVLKDNRYPLDPKCILDYPLLQDQTMMNRWPEWFRAAGLEVPESFDSASIIDPNVRVQSAIDGHGIVLANPLLKPDIDSGSLVEPFNVRLSGYGYYLLYKQTGNEKKDLCNCFEIGFGSSFECQFLSSNKEQAKLIKLTSLPQALQKSIHRQRDARLCQISRKQYVLQYS